MDRYIRQLAQAVASRVLRAKRGHNEKGRAGRSVFEQLEMRQLLSAPVVANPIGERAFPEDSAIVFAVPDDTFTVDEGSGPLSYGAALADDSPLPDWLSFDSDTKTFTSAPGMPDDAEIGDYVIKLTATSSSDESVSDTFTLSVTPVNDAPTLANVMGDQSVLAGASRTIAVPDNTFADEDGEALSYSAKAVGEEGDQDLPAWLTFDAATKTFTAVPTEGDVGSITVKVIASDAEASASGTFTLTVAADNAPTVANPIDAQSATQDVPFSFTFGVDTFNDEDAGDSLTYTATLDGGDSLPGWLSFDADTRTFSGTPANGDVGTIQVKVTATDTANQSVSTTFALAVANVNDAPALLNPIGSQTAREDVPFTFTVPADTFQDIDVGDSLTYTATLDNGDPLPEWLSFDADTQTFSGTPANGDVGTMIVKVTATDQEAASASSAFDLNVEHTNHVPVGAGDEYTYTEDTPLVVSAQDGVLKNDTDADGDILTAVLVDQAQHGEVVLNADGSYTYTPAANYHGPDSFTYQAGDGTAASDLVTVRLSGTAVADAPTNDGYTTAQNTPLTTTVANGVLSNDADGSDEGIVATLVSSPVNGTLDFQADGTFTYTPNPGFVGNDVFQYSIHDGLQVSNVANVVITVAAPAAPENHAPVAANLVATRALGQSVRINVLASASDPDNDKLGIAIATQPVHGRVIVHNAGTPQDPSDDYLEYVPNPDYFGSDAFTYKVTDGKGGESTGLVAVKMTGTVGLAVNPFNSKQRDLIVLGTKSNDKVVLTKTAQGVKVVVNGKSRGVFKVTGRVVVRGVKSDALLMTRGLGRPLWLYAGAAKNVFLR